MQRDTTASNHGEGNPEAARRFNKAEQEFVHSRRGQQKIGEAGDEIPELELEHDDDADLDGAGVDRDDEAQLDEAERTSRSQPRDSSSGKG